MKKEDKKEIDELIKGLNKDFGEETIITKPLKIDVIPTGSVSLDKALGVGGLPRGRIVEIFGPESGGKTSLALSVISQAQKLGGTAAYIDVEQSLDPSYARKLGVNFEEMLLTQPSKGEDALNIMLRMIESKQIDVVVLDSIAALEPSAEAEGEIGMQTMGLKARLMSQAMRRLTPVIAKSNTLAIFINQVRMKIGGMSWGNPETTPGGNAMKFAATIRLDIRRMSTIKDGEDSVGILIKAKVVKNKVAPPYKQAQFSLMFNDGISNSADCFNVGVECGIINKTGNTYFYGKEKLGVGMKASMNTLKTNETLMKEIVEKITLKEDE